jgi:hypothetical protein
MTPRDHLDNPEAPASPQAPIRDLPHVSCGHMIYGVDGRESTRLMHYPKVNTTRVRPDLI